MPKQEINSFELETKTSGPVRVAVDERDGNIIIWDGHMEYGLYFTLEEWEQISTYILAQFKKINENA